MWAHLIAQNLQQLLKHTSIGYAYGKLKSEGETPVFTFVALWEVDIVNQIFLDIPTVYLGNKIF